MLMFNFSYFSTFIDWSCSEGIIVPCLFYSIISLNFYSINSLIYFGYLFYSLAFNTVITYIFAHIVPTLTM